LGLRGIEGKDQGQCEQDRFHNGMFYF
jgi:hypothetical protein